MPGALPGTYNVWTLPDCVQANDEGNPGVVDPSTGSNVCAAGYWSTFTVTPVTSTLDDRANALAHALNKTGVQSLANPCTIAGFYLVSGTGGALGVATANAPTVVAAASEEYPSLAHRFLTWISSRQPVATGRLSGAFALVRAAPAKIQSACSELQ